MRRAALCLLLAGCGPVLLGDEAQSAQDGGNNGDAGTPPQVSDASPGVVVPVDAGPRPEVVVRVKPLDCGRCFELLAEGSGGQPPYDFQWEDGTLRAQREVCVAENPVGLYVVALDATHVRSVRHVIQLESVGDASCPTGMEPDDAGTAPLLCLENPSFEGTPAVNVGDGRTFDAAPWSECDPVGSNTPDIGSPSISVTGTVPPATNGATYLSLSEGEQASQELCSELVGGVPVHVQIDLARIDFSGGVAPDGERVFLEIWGGLSVDCSRRELLWASDALTPDWQRFCVTLQPDSFVTQLTLRANSDMSSLNPAYVLVDNMQAVDACP